MSNITSADIDRLLTPSRMADDFLDRVQWHLRPDGSFRTTWHGGKWMLSILKPFASNSFEVAICFGATGDILTVRHFQSREDIIQITQDIIDQTL